jgi:RimJ/RimL family protein N-acetyltransferase
MSLTPETETELIRGFIKGNNKIFGIVDKETDKLIGGVGLHDIDFINGMGMYGIYIGEKEFRGKGYGKEATFLLMDYGFNILNLYNIYLMVFEYNKTAVKCYERWGFNLIGRRRKAKKIAGQRFDIIMMDMLADEFKSVYVGGLVDEAINP